VPDKTTVFEGVSYICTSAVNSSRHWIAQIMVECLLIFRQFNLCLSCMQYNETADYVHRCFNGTLVQANNINKQVDIITWSFAAFTATTTNIHHSLALASRECRSILSGSGPEVPDSSLGPETPTIILRHNSDCPLPNILDHLCTLNFHYMGLLIVSTLSPFTICKDTFECFARWEILCPSPIFAAYRRHCPVTSADFCVCSKCSTRCQ